MDKKIVVLIRAGVPYKNTISYGRQRAREAGAKLLLVGVVPDLNLSRRTAFASFEIGPYSTISKKMEEETSLYLDRAVQFCLDNAITVETQTETGGIESSVKKFAKDPNVKLVVVPTPSKKEHHSEFLDAIKHFAHDVLDYELCCPVVTVLAT
jgi:nucleotide-binding universal stress UspA family protein